MTGASASATRLIHDLRAVAGTLGALDVEQHARALETACRDGKSAENLEALAERVSEALAPVMAGLSTLGS